MDFAFAGAFVVEVEDCFKGPLWPTFGTVAVLVISLVFGLGLSSFFGDDDKVLVWGLFLSGLEADFEQSFAEVKHFIVFFGRYKL